MSRILEFRDAHGDVAEFDLMDDGTIFVSANDHGQVLLEVEEVAKLYHALSYILPAKLK